MPSSVMWLREDHVRTDVSEERVISFFTVERISEQETTIAVTRYPSTLKMEATHSTETSVITSPTRRNFPEYGILHSHRSENLKS
jgi:hypothetical protein